MSYATGAIVGGQSVSTNQLKQTSFTETVVSRMRRLIDQLEQNNIRIDATLNRAFGPVPEAAANKATPPISSGHVSSINDCLDTIEGLISRNTGLLARLEDFV